MVKGKRTTVSISVKEKESIKKALVGTETLSGFVHDAITSAIKKRCGKNETGTNTI